MAYVSASFFLLLELWAKEPRLILPVHHLLSERIEGLGIFRQNLTEHR